MLVAGVTIAGLSNAATSPAETAGMCAGNAAFIKMVADKAGIPSLSAKAAAQSARNFNRYDGQPGFKQAFEWQIKQKLSADDRLRIADGCAAQGF